MGCEGRQQADSPFAGRIRAFRSLTAPGRGRSPGPAGPGPV